MGVENQNFPRIERILPPDLQAFYIKARQETYASSKPAVFGLNVVGFKGYKFYDNETDYFYQDNYMDKEKRPGNFGGWELITKYSFGGPRLSFYTYGGGLTAAGLIKGEKAVYGQLKKFLAERATEARFGKSLRGGTWVAHNQWNFRSDGKIHDWGWEDAEQIALNNNLVYEFRGVGVVFVS